MAVGWRLAASKSELSGGVRTTQLQELSGGVRTTGLQLSGGVRTTQLSGGVRTTVTGCEDNSYQGV